MHPIGRIAAAGVLATAALTATLPSAYATGRHPPPRMHVMALMAGEMHIERMARWLRLSPEQLEQVRAAVDAIRPRLRHALDGMSASRQRLGAVMRAPKFEPKALEEAARAQGRAIANMIVVRSELQHRVLAILTPEQRKRLEAMRAHRGWGRWHHGPMFGHRPAPGGHWRGAPGAPMGDPGMPPGGPVPAGGD